MLHSTKSTNFSYSIYIIFSFLTKCLCGWIKRFRGSDEIASRAGFGPRAVVWRPLSWTLTQMNSLNAFCVLPSCSQLKRNKKRFEVTLAVNLDQCKVACLFYETVAKINTVWRSIKKVQHVFCVVPIQFCFLLCRVCKECAVCIVVYKEFYIVWF